MAGDGLLERAREARGISRKELALRAGVGLSSVSDVEYRGGRASLMVLERYGAAMGLKLVVQYVTETGDIID